MKTLSVMSLAFAACVAVPAAAAAQDAGRVGITTGYPASIGVLWHATKGIAIRPDVSFGHLSSATEANLQLPLSLIGCDFCIPTGLPDATSIKRSTSSWALNVSGLFYLGEPNALRTFISPRFEYSHVSTSTDYGGDFAPEDTDSPSSQYGVGGSFGVEFSVHRKVSLFAEAGLEYRWYDTGDDLRTFDVSSHGYGTRTAVGVIFYFGK